jgi:hypothetical protein
LSSCPNSIDTHRPHFHASPTQTLLKANQPTSRTMANTRAFRMFLATEMFEMRKTTEELTNFVALLTPIGESCAFNSIKGELSWHSSFEFFGNNTDYPIIFDEFVSSVMSCVQKAMGASLHLSAKEVVKGWVEEMLSQTSFIARSYWDAIHMTYYDNDEIDETPVFKRCVVRPETFAECFPRIHAYTVEQEKQPVPQTPPNCYCYTPLIQWGPTEALSIIDNHQRELAEQEERIRQAQVVALMEG